MTHRFHTPGGAPRAVAMLAAIATLFVAVAASNIAPASATTSHTRTDEICQTQTMAITNAKVYTVCLTATDTYNGTTASGYVSGVNCNIYLPTGAGWFCDSQAHGSYRTSSGVWEDWLNFRVSYISPLVIYNVHYSSCIYLRVDTKPNGSTSFQNFANKNLPIGTHC